MSGIGFNILGDFVDDRERLYGWLDAARPAAVVVMDNFGMALEIKRRLPECDVIFRAYDPHNHEWHRVATPAAWLALHTRYTQNGIIVQALNEPSGYGDVVKLVDWAVELMRLATEQGVRLCLPNFAVEHPDMELLQRGAFDALLRALAGSAHLLGLHEYFIEQADVGEQRVGRYQYWLQRAQAIGVSAPRIVMTEFGRDVAGGERDGWRDAGWSEAEYADRLIWAHRHWYALNGVATCIFSYGYGGARRWESFNLEGADDLLGRISAYNTRYPAQVEEAQPGIVSMPGPYVNLRAAPSVAAADQGDLHDGDRVRYYPTVVLDAQGRQWYRVAEPVGFAAGWLLRVDPVPEVPPSVVERLTRAELARLQDLNAEIAAILLTASQR